MRIVGSGLLLAVITIGLIHSSCNAVPCPKCAEDETIADLAYYVQGSDGITYFNPCYLFCWSEAHPTECLEPEKCDAWIDKYGPY